MVGTRIRAGRRISAMARTARMVLPLKNYFTFIKNDYSISIFCFIKIMSNR